MKITITVLAGILFLSSCYHTKKAITELSRRVDSTGYFKKDSSYRNKKDSSNTTFDLHGIDVYIPEDTPTKPDDIGVDPNTIDPADYFPPAELARIKKLFQPNIKKGSGGISIHIDSATVTHGSFTTINSGKGSRIDSVHKMTDEQSKTKNIDRHGTSVGGSIGLVIGIILAVLLVAAFIYAKIKKFI